MAHKSRFGPELTEAESAALVDNTTYPWEHQRRVVDPGIFNNYSTRACWILLDIK